MAEEKFWNPDNKLNSSEEPPLEVPQPGTAGEYQAEKGFYFFWYTPPLKYPEVWQL